MTEARAIRLLAEHVLAATTHDEVLGLVVGAEHDVVLHKYRQLALVLHPDKCTNILGAVKATEVMQRLNVSKDVLLGQGTTSADRRRPSTPSATSTHDKRRSAAPPAKAEKRPRGAAHESDDTMPQSAHPPASAPLPVRLKHCRVELTAMTPIVRGHTYLMRLAEGPVLGHSAAVVFDRKNSFGGCEPGSYHIVHATITKMFFYQMEKMLYLDGASFSRLGPAVPDPPRRT
jgi:hypothetical protein